MQTFANRRSFIAGVTAAGAAGLFRTTTRARAEAPLETTSVRLPIFPKVADCLAPIYIARKLLQAEGFQEIAFISSGSGPDLADWLEQRWLPRMAMAAAMTWPFAPSVRVSATMYAANMIF